MNLATLTTRLRTAGRSGRLLVVESDGFVLRVVIVKVVRGVATVERVSQSRLSDPLAGLGDALEGLRGSKIPKRAVLLSADVTSAILRLPIDPQSPRPALEMQELIRWELEPHVAVHTGARPIGEILIGRGHLTAQQVHEVLEEQNDRKIAAAASGGRRPERFGEIAISLALTTRGQVEEALEIQRRFQIPVDDLVCGWTPLVQTQADEAGQWKWLACGMGRATRDRWAQAFDAQGLQLSAIYPLLGASVAALDAPALGGVQGVLEMQTGQISAARLNGGHLDTWQWHLLAGQEPTVELCQDLLGAESAAGYWITGRHPALESVVQDLAPRLDAPLHRIPASSEALLPPDVSAESLTACLGVARHAMGAAASDVSVSLAAHDPGPPAWQRPQVWAAAIVVTLLLVVGASEFLMRRTLASLNADQAAASEKLAMVQSKVSELEAGVARVESLKKQVAERSDELNVWAQLHRFLGEDLPRRQRFLPELFQALKQTASDEIAVERIAESSHGEIKITFWSLSNEAAERFAKALHTQLGVSQLAVTTRSMEAQPGRLDLSGFLFNLELHAPEATPAVSVTSSASGEPR